MPRPPAHEHQIREVNRIARRQLGLITSGQLDRTGIAPGVRDKALSAARLESVRPGVYLLPGVQPTWHTAVMAAVLAAGPQAVASHGTAAILWCLFDGPPPRQLERGIHLIVPRRRRLEGVVVHRHVLTARERAHRRSVPVTSAARTLFDLASVVDAEQLGRCTDEALRRRILNLRDVDRILDLHGGGGRRRLAPLREVLAERLPGYDPGANVWEKEMDRQWDLLGLPPAERQCWVVTAGGRYRLDRAIPELRLGVEWVGEEFHGQKGRFARDRIRISNLVQMGWDVVEVTPGWTSERVRRTVLAKVAERERLFGRQVG